jgi:sporulation protein YlmC with PRC-barrel domain
MITFRTALALAAATALGAATLPAVAQTEATTEMESESMEMQTTGALGEVSQVFLNADDLEDIEVYGIGGENIGEVENVVVAPDGTHYFVVEVGGFLEMGDEDVAIPMDRFAARDDESLVLTAMTADELEALAEATDELTADAGTRVLGPDDEITVRMMQ